jgi:DinB superfamily
MQYERLTGVERETLLKDLGAMADFLSDRFSALSAAEAAASGPDGGFSPVEQCWHLADLEREGFAVRIRRLLSEVDPILADFDGDRAAAERQYRLKSVGDGIKAFREARAANLALIRAIAADAWSRTGTQEGVGRVALCDMPSIMAQHDRAHRAEIAAWFARGSA